MLKWIMNCARSYRWRRLRALYLKSKLVWRKVCALWKYNELVLTNHAARISRNILQILIYIYVLKYKKYTTTNLDVSISIHTAHARFTFLSLYHVKWNEIT